MLHEAKEWGPALSSIFVNCYPLLWSYVATKTPIWRQEMTHTTIHHYIITLLSGVTWPLGPTHLVANDASQSQLPAHVYDSLKLPTNHITDAHVVDLPTLHKVVECSERLLQWSAIIPAVCLGGERKGEREGRKRQRGKKKTEREEKDRERGKEERERRKGERGRKETEREGRERERRRGERGKEERKKERRKERGEREKKEEREGPHSRLGITDLQRLWSCTYKPSLPTMMLHGQQLSMILSKSRLSLIVSLSAGWHSPPLGELPRQQPSAVTGLCGTCLKMYLPWDSSVHCTHLHTPNHFKWSIHPSFCQC